MVSSDQNAFPNRAGLMRMALCAALGVVLVLDTPPATAFQGVGGDPHHSSAAHRYNVGFGRRSMDESRPFRPRSFRDEENNAVIIGGRPAALSGGVGSARPGDTSLSSDIGFGGTTGDQFTATAIGNLLNITVEGSGNTVIVDAEQVNNGDVSAKISADR